MNVCRLLWVPVFLLSALALRADFSGDYSLGAAQTYNFVTGGSTGIGSWGAVFTTTGGSGSVNTSSAPGSVTLSATGNGGMGVGFMSTLAMTYTFTTSGPVAFSYSVGNAGGSFNVQLDSVTQTASGLNYAFSVSSGQVLSLNLSAMGSMGFLGMFPTPGFPATQTVTLTNFSGPSAIPEPSSVAFLAGLGALGLGLTRRRRV
ncbi:MAG: PEP-CTERM sorting domain-containing protein [Verrucomicrobia bacterium]|nr:PEP-CTERM sorting domain-containing protein [Verrucomicrobiota bacterium]